MIIQLKDRCKGYSELFKEHFNHLHNYTIDTEKIVYISDKSYSDSRENCTIHFINGEILKIYNHEYDEVVNMIYGDFKKEQ